MKDPSEMYVKFPMTLMSVEHVSLTEFKILCLIATFKDKGLGMGTDRIAQIIKRSPTHVSRSFTSLENKGLIRIEKKQSQYRRAYLTENTIPLQHTEQSGNNSTSTCRAESLQHREQSTSTCRAESILSKGSKREIEGKETFGNDKFISGDRSQQPEESMRPADWKEGYSYACPEEYAEQLLGEIEE